MMGKKRKAGDNKGKLKAKAKKESSLHKQQNDVQERLKMKMRMWKMIKKKGKQEIDVFSFFSLVILM